jgi:hypothetical protein
MKKRKGLFLSVLLISINFFGQSNEELLNTKIGNFDNEIIKKLINRGLISDLDSKMLGIYIVKLVQEEKIDTLKYSQLLIKYQDFKQKMNNKLVREDSFGKDSIFIRTPFGDRIFLGMGELSLENLVKRESFNLPREYESIKLNENIESPRQVANIFKELNLSPKLSMLFGNVLLIIGESGKDIHSYKIGDFLEIAKRIKNSKEFKPLLNKFEDN